jgi:hypothetical protein
MMGNSVIATRVGWVLSLLVVVFMLFDGGAGIARAGWVVQSAVDTGFPASTVMPIGVIALACALLYAVPQTAVLGAILLTGYLGGATVAHVRIGGDMTPVVISLLIGVFAWAGLWLRDTRLRALMPWQRD